MVKHIVLWKIRDDAQKNQNIDKMINDLTSLVGKIEGLVSMEMGYNFNTASDYDVVLYATFKNAAALKYYRTHPEHVKCAEFVKSVSIDRTAADYFYEEGVTASRPFDEVPDAPVPEAPIAFDPFQQAQQVNPFIEFEASRAGQAAADPVVEEPVVPEPVVETPVVPEPVVETPVVPEPVVEEPVVPEPVVEEPVVPEPVAEAPVEEPRPAKKPNPFKNFPIQKPAEAAEPAPAPAPAPAPVEEPKPKQGLFGKKKMDVQVTPLEQRSDTWTCPSCGKVMPKYVGTCGCGEPQPFSFDDSPPALQPDFNEQAQKNVAAATAPKAAAPAEEPKQKQGLFGKKKVDVQVTPLEQRSDTWTCPSCGKVMPKYVGTCGCGEPQPFSFDDPPPALQPDFNEQAQKNVAAATAPKAAAPAEEPKQKQGLFGKKKVDVQVTPLEQRSDTWTCPSCGKVMPKYVGTCGCGEPQPFSFDDPPPALQPDFNEQAQKNVAAATAPKAAAPAEEPKQKQGLFGKKKVDVQVTPLEQRSDTWTCPSCGKVMPKYVGTCGCGEPQPFSFDDPPPALQPDFNEQSQKSVDNFNKMNKTPVPAKKRPESARKTSINEKTDNTWVCPKCGKTLQKYISTCPCGEPQPSEFDFADNASKAKMPEIVGAEEENVDDRIMSTEEFNNAAPSLQSYSPQTDGNHQAPQPPESDTPAAKPFGGQSAAPVVEEDDDMSSRFDFDNAPPPAPMRFDDAPPPAPMRFDDAPPPAPMRFDDAPPPAPMRFEDAPPPAPMKFEDAPPPAPMKFEEQKKPEPAPAPKKHLFGKKAKEAEAIRQAEAVVNSRKDVPDIGATWTCPNCGKVMPKYVGTCGCGEPQPFDF